ncbi:MAG: succinate dehydrogenase assembly factor 4 [Candidatus Puniceispirillum sp.]
MPASKAGETGQSDADPMPPEVNGPKGPEPTRYGDWEQKGRCTDF